jgi:YfiH family protein
MFKSNTLNTKKSGEVVFLTFPKIEAAGGVTHGFSTRLGGVSEGHCSSMSFGFSLGDREADVYKNFEIFCRAIGADCKNVVLSQQTHTANLRVVTAADRGKGLFCDRDYSDIDGLVTNEKGLLLVTQYADCTPLAFYDPVKRVVATSHAGWRGTVQEIAAKTVELMVSRFSCDPKDILCGIGPNIGKCCYEVDDPVINEINKLSYLDFKSCYTAKENGKYMLDLREVNREILIHCGILPENIDTADLCTCCNSDIFHSHRATKGKRGTLALIIALSKHE